MTKKWRKRRRAQKHTVYCIPTYAKPENDTREGAYVIILALSFGDIWSAVLRRKPFDSPRSRLLICVAGGKFNTTLLWILERNGFVANLVSNKKVPCHIEWRLDNIPVKGRKRRQLGSQLELNCIADLKVSRCDVVKETLLDVMWEYFTSHYKSTVEKQRPLTVGDKRTTLRACFGDVRDNLSEKEGERQRCGRRPCNG